MLEANALAESRWGGGAIGRQGDRWDISKSSRLLMFPMGNS
jgi:hypothetical protein